jgi:peptidoglycan LD-endopeptidase LytH
VANPLHSEERTQSVRFSRRHRVAVGCLLLAVVVSVAVVVTLKRPILAIQLVLATQPQALSVPVQGVSPRRLLNSWGAPRSGGRQHRGIDIFAPRGTAVIANTRGLVLTVGTNRLGGNIVKVLGPGPQVHYYAHLDRFGQFERGDLVRPGDVLGYVGTTGNARGTPPHLHYGIYAFPGFAINPYPLLELWRPVA